MPCPYTGPFLCFPLPANCGAVNSPYLDPNMKNKELNAVVVWKQMEDQVVPQLRLSLADRAVYSNLLRHSRIEGKVRLHFSILWLARGTCLSTGTAREAVRRLVGKGALRLKRVVVRVHPDEPNPLEGLTDPAT
jgi:hypothetical protein